MRVKVALAVASVAGIALLGFGGYFLYGKVRCDAFENDYLNSVGSMRNRVLLQGVVPGNALSTTELADLERAELRIIELRLRAIYQECGDRAGGTAARKGSELVLGS